jgi:hypothetical protein
MIYALRCRLVRWLACRDSFIVNVSIKGSVHIPVGSRGLYFDGGRIDGVTEREAQGTGDALP